jgi:hypothetical protein
MVDKPRARDGQEASSSDWYVTGGVNWPGFSLLELVTMVAEGASVPQLERLAVDWRNAGDGIVDTADFLADALNELMNYWTGTSAEAARTTVALNAQWVLDLGTTARDISGPIEESAGALKAAQEAMPQLPEIAPLAAFQQAQQAQDVQQAPIAQQDSLAQQASAPINARRAAALTGSPMGGAVGATAAGSRSAFADQAEQAEAKRVAVETMQRFETATVGIDRSTPRFLGQNDELVPRDDLVGGSGDEEFANQVGNATGIDRRWGLLTNLPLDATTAQRLGLDGANLGLISGSQTGLGGIGGGAGAMNLGPLAGGNSQIGGIGGEGPGGVGGAVPAARGGVLPTSAAGAIGGANAAHGMAAPVGATPMGAGAVGASAAQAHRRRVPYDADDPFDTGQKASPPVIGL